jgi:hypothetical protein
MRMFVRALVLIPLLSFAGCGGGDGADAMSKSAGLGSEFVLGYGETAAVGPLTLRFVAVTEESRCPINLMCVRAGNGRIQVAAASRGHSDILDLGIPEGPNFATFDGHVIELVHLDPLPVSPNPPPSHASYRATLRVDGPVAISGG